MLTSKVCGMTTDEMIARMQPLTQFYRDRASERAMSAMTASKELADRFCESPIEKVLFVAWRMYLCQAESEIRLSNNCAWEPMSWSANYQCDMIATQVHVEGFRVDFMLCRSIRSEIREDPFISTPIMVECDGHQFHEKTKEQVRADNERDRILQSAGFPVHRFSGSEIWLRPLQCAEGIEKTIGDDIERQVVAWRESRGGKS